MKLFKSKVVIALSGCAMLTLLTQCSPPSGGGSSKKSSNTSNSQIGSSQSESNADTAPHETDSNPEYQSFITAMGDDGTGEAAPTDNMPPSNPAGLDPSQVPSVPAGQIECYADNQRVSTFTSVAIPVCGRGGRPNISFNIDAVLLADCDVESGGTVKIYARAHCEITSGGSSNCNGPRLVSGSQLFAFYTDVLGSGNRFSSAGMQEYFPKGSNELKAALIKISALKDASTPDTYCTNSSDIYMSKVGKVLADNRTGMTYRRLRGFNAGEGQDSNGSVWTNKTGEQQRNTIHPLSCRVFKPICPNKKQTAPAPIRTPAPGGK